jgi:hypothetical protein
MRLILSIVYFWILFSGIALASTPNGGYRIEIEMKNFTGDSLRLGYYFGKAQYIKDTAIINKGKFVFDGDQLLEPGVYLIVIPPDNRFVHILITEDQQRFSLVVDVNDIVPSIRFKGSPENDIYYDYLRKLDGFRPRADELKKLVVTDSLKKETYQKELGDIDDQVKSLQNDIRKKYPNSLTTLLIFAHRELDVPDFPELDEVERRQKLYEYYRAHFFDLFDLNDPRVMRTGLMQQKIDFFLQKLSYQVPDSQSLAMDYLLKKMDNNPEAFQ